MEPFELKIKNSLSEALPLINKWKRSNEVIVFTNGCFDILHPGHLTYLQEARSLGSKLIIGLNDNDSVRRLKGEKRPIYNLLSRSLLLAGLAMVDMVIPFSEDTPLELIKDLSPDVLVKGGDYEINEIVGADHVISNGGKVEKLVFKNGFSTSNIINTIIEKYCND